MHRIRITVLCLIAVCATVAAQDEDRRDVVVLESGKTIEGRVAEPYHPDEVLVMQGGKRVRVPREKVREIRLVRHAVAGFLAERDRAGAAIEAQWQLVAHAEERGLHRLADLQAIHVVLTDDAHESAHRHLGHRRHPRKGWMWPEDDRWLTREELEEHHSEWGRALELGGEHFVVRTSAGLRLAVDALFDLERLYVFFFDEFGTELRLAEALRRMELRVWKDVEDFPKWTGEAIPYFVPHPFADAGHSFRRPAENRPAALFALGTQMILYRCLARDANPGGPQQRYCATAELGLSRFVESRFTGPPGRATVSDPLLPAEAAWLALRARRYGLENLLHLTVRDHFYGGLGEGPAVHWASAHAFVAWHLDPADTANRRDEFLTWLHAALAEGKGDSSSAFDDAFGTPVEELEEPFAAWLAARTGR